MDEGSRTGETVPHEVAIQIAHEAWLDWFTPESWQNHISSIIIQALSGVKWKHPAEISVLLTDDAYTRELNETYRKQAKPTNVLSFPSLTPEELKTLPPKSNQAIILGDIVLSFETVLKEAEAQNKRFLDHVLHLLVHGTLHLIGYDHETDDEAEEMESLEAQILQSMGIPNPYH
jgi:probable rRNA maturation factor